MDKIFTFETFEPDGFTPETWKGTLNEAMNIALGEIHEHAGGCSAAYTFTAEVFKEMQKRLQAKA